MKITNTGDVCLPLAVWLLHDQYDHIDIPNYISVTTLMKPIRQIVLPARIPPQQRTMDVADLIAARYGTSVHDSIEKAWTSGSYVRSLKLLGYPEAVIDRIRINPTPDEIVRQNDIIPVYLEQRNFKEFEGFTIGGKFDMVTEGIVQDNKSTSVWSWIMGSRDDDHRLQLSLYRWLNPTIITEEFGQVHYIFTDWSKMEARRKSDYPQRRVLTKELKLLSLDETEAWVRWKLGLVKANMNKPETEIMRCSDEELWRSAPRFKYFSDPIKAKDPTARSTRNFDTLLEANQHAAAAGKGVVVTVPGEVKRCAYCNAFEGCTQKDEYFS